ncbi:MAG: class I SAM-dependent methyltransferase [Gemmatimonadetes bacterium]|uniref:Class I SAM-dependent methyltransferase n=1 Tax=Candidatus Kutchimonas denitrificans TaxID=3056748 RepID=A0AAE4Z6G2_9BACT|nr:class I SAM-dependent methyltransferase [Gemmatimonadota bacterium]NIR74468.1 class I SAM-dependent methyltransferase [Candidatus Kutchimonas denitrificans]NIS00864.1 class I SAM-dependent methyltransferase [Gemmatimonadota bacterium]NIT66487.1 class I SAM-dependent methyltransferase [Gemmatimonadota bacterium]NIU52118.1 methyltransferase domain-containing protein [Gemmatimonadota bacterium]
MSIKEMKAEEEFTFKAFSEHDFYKEVNQALVNRAHLERGWTVVDVACGSGAITELILEKIRGARDAMVIGVDMSATALRDARTKVAGYTDAMVEFVQARAEEMSERIRQAVDAVVFCNGIHYIEDKCRLLSEVRQTLRPGGVFAFNTGFFDGALPDETKAYYKRWMLKALRTLKREHDLRPEHSKVESRRTLTADEYCQLLTGEGFEIETAEIYPGQVTEQGWIDLSRFSDFIEGTLPGVPLKTASEVLVQSLKETFAELEMNAWPRNWLTVVAARR